MKSRWQEFLGMILIGDGILNLLQPDRHSAIWNCGPEAYRKAARKLQEQPNAARGLGLAFVALGIWLGRRAAKAL
jgi:uncharacterized protein YjeT (DUF2065 family)